MPSPTHIVVLGGGLSGLSSTFHLARRFPSTSITLVESSHRLGGWVNSERVTVQDASGHEAKMLLEMGPRTLRPNGKAVLELINLLNLTPSLLTIPRTAPGAQNRFLHVPGTQGLTALPSSVLSGRSLILAVIREPFRLYPRPTSPEDADEALEPFLASHLNPEVARILGSALVHGIYAGDSRVLSVRAAFGPLWDIAQEGGGSIGRGLAWHLLRHTLGLAPKKPKKEYNTGEVSEIMRGISVYSFRDGMSTLVNALESDLSRRSNVTVLKGDGADTIQRPSEGDMKLLTSTGKTLPVSHLVSALPLHILRDLLQRSSLPVLPHLTANPLSSVTVVNLVFPPTPPDQPIHPDGFGYLIPRDEDGRVEVLGTVFDSCSLGGQDEYPEPNAPRFTKMTMMLRYDPSIPVTQERVLAHLKSHLDVQSLPDPVLFRVHHHRNCIPVPTVGHVQRMRELGDAVRKGWGDSLTVLGAGVGGVSVPDCIEQGRQVGANW